MNENDMIAEFVREKYPELLKTYDFALFRLNKTALNLRSNIAESLNKIDFESIKKEFKEFENRFYLFQRTDHKQDGFRANIYICDEIEHEKTH